VERHSAFANYTVDKGESVSYPVTFEADYVDQRSRLTAFFRLILAIPLLIVLYVYAIIASIAVVIAWFAIVITARYPRGLYDFIAGYLRFLTRVTAYAALLCDPYAPFGGSPDDSYPVRMDFAGPLEQYSRLKTFFRIIIAIPLIVIRYIMGLLLEIGALFAWFVIVVTGKMPRGLFDLMVLANSYTARSDAYLLLLTETYPPFQDEQTRAAGTAGSPTPPPAPPSAPPIAPS
jgi:small-conductance mechanosensitive channel